MKLETPTHILVKRKSALGDVIMTTGVVRELYKKHNGLCKITVETENPIVYKNNPYVDEIRNYGEVNPTDFDVVYNLDDAYEVNPAYHLVGTYFNRVFGNNDLDRSVDLHVDNEDRQRVDDDIKNLIDGPFFAVHMRQWYWPHKNMSIDVWAEIFAMIFEQRVDHKIMLVGGPTDFSLEHPLIINALARYTPQQLAYLLNHAKCFVGTDSAPFQIAGASKTHIIGLFTHQVPEYILPDRNNQPMWNSTGIQAAVECAGCVVNQRRPIRQIECKWGDYRCSNTWDTHKIADAILEQLKL